MQLAPSSLFWKFGKPLLGSRDRRRQGTREHTVAGSARIEMTGPIVHVPVHITLFNEALDDVLITVLVQVHQDQFIDDGAWSIVDREV